METKDNLKQPRRIHRHPILKRSEVTNTWFFKWVKAMTRNRTKISSNTWVKTLLQFSIIQAQYNFKCLSRCWLPLKRNLETWKRYYPRRKIPYQLTKIRAATLKIIQVLCQYLHRINTRCLTAKQEQQALNLRMLPSKISRSPKPTFRADKTTWLVPFLKRALATTFNL